MDKKKKTILIITIIFLLTLIVGSVTYAMYRASVQGTGTVKIAKWDIKLNGTAIDEASFNFGVNDITWTSNPGKNNTIAPGARGYIDIEVDATGTEVGVIISSSVGSTTLPQGMTVSLANGEQTIPYNSTDMSTTVRLNIEWTGAISDTIEKDTSDKSVQGTTINIPVTLTARQVLPE